MAKEILTCPYCNASLDASAGWPVGQRIVCPRCGDSFTVRPRDAFTEQLPSPPSSGIVSTASVSPPEVALPPRWSHRLIAGIIVSVMVLIAGGSLVFMLMTQPQRRAYDTSRPPRRPGKQLGILEADNGPFVPSVAPDKLAALGYLPSNIHFLLAVRFPELLAHPLGRQMLREPIQRGQTPFRLEELPQWLGFHIEEIDHLVFAARLDDAMPPPFYLVLRTVQPYDQEQFRQRLKGIRVAKSSKKKLYAFRIPQPDIQLNAWPADEHTVVVALFADQLESLPSHPVEELQQLPQELRTVLKQRREAVAPVWIAGHSPDWEKTSAALFLNRIKPEERKKLALLRTFGIWIAFDHSLVIRGVFACKDASGAQQWERYLRDLRGSDTHFKTALDGPWLTLQFHADPDFLTGWLKR